MNIDPNRLKSPVGVLCIAQIDVVQWLVKQLPGYSRFCVLFSVLQNKQPPYFWTLVPVTG